MQAFGEELAQELQSGCVQPVQILNDKQDWLACGRVCSHSNMRWERLFALPDWGESGGGKRFGVGSESSEAHSGTVSGRARPYCSRRWSS